MFPVSKYMKSAMFAAVFLAVVFVTRPAHAQVGAGEFGFSTDRVSVSNGYSNESGPNAAVGVALASGVSVNGVTGNNGTTYVTCYDSQQGQIFSFSTQYNTQVSFQWTPIAGPHQVYCTAMYGGQHINATVNTPTITFTAN